MRDWKYIMVQVGDNRYPVLFPQELVHRFVAQGIERAIIANRDPRSAPVRPEVVSAGFVSGVSVFKAFGESESLGIKSHPDDTVRINNDMLRHRDPEPEPEPVPAAEEPFDPNRGRVPRNYGTWDKPKSFTQLQAEKRRDKRLAARKK